MALIGSLNSSHAPAINDGAAAPAGDGVAARGFTTQVDNPVDYIETAQAADAAFAQIGKFRPESLHWLYESCFSLGSKVVSLRSGRRKVGQFVILRQKLVQNGQLVDAAQLVDLFVLPEFRSRHSLAALYGAVEQLCKQDGVHYAFGMPNQRAISANEHFIGLKPHVWLDIRAGVAMSFGAHPKLFNSRLEARDREQLISLFRQFEPPLRENGVLWTAETLLSRLQRPGYRYGIHATEQLLLVSSPRTRKGVPYTLLCAFFPKDGASPAAADIRAVTGAACSMWMRPLYFYPGMQLAMRNRPGWRLPMWMRPSTMLIQLRQFDDEAPPLALDRYQSIDFDFG